jgi:hypothetical protein
LIIQIKSNSQNRYNSHSILFNKFNEKEIRNFLDLF